PYVDAVQAAHDSVAQRVFGPERLPRQRFADDRDCGPLVHIAVVELASAEQRDTESAEVRRARQAETSRGQQPEISAERVAAFDGIRAVRIVLSRGQTH